MEKMIQILDKKYLLTSDDTYLDRMGDNFEPAMVSLFLALVHPDDVVADIGANIGLTSILFSSLAKRVISFEPSPSTYQILVENLSRAKADNVEPINLGLGNQAESQTITFAENNRSGGYVSEKIRPEKGHRTEQITLDTLDHFFNSRSVPPPNFLKIDVEGFEQNVIEGAKQILQSNKPIVVMELNHFCLDVLQRITIPDFLDYMRSVFPYLYAIDHGNQNVVDIHIPEKAYNVMHEHVVHSRFPNIVGGFSSEIKEKLDDMRIQQAVHQAELRAQQAEIEAQQAVHQAELRVQQAASEADSCRQEAQNAHAQLRALYASRSWRITKPLRGLKRLLR